MPEIGLQGQKRIKDRRVLVIGAGGLGCPVLQYLAAAGFGTIGIVDGDVVSLSNLQRQTLYSVDDIDKSKAVVAKDKLEALNPNLKIIAHANPLTSENALAIAADYDILIDGSDNFPTRYLVNDTSVLLDKPNIYGSIFRFEGQVSVFNNQRSDGQRGPNYRDLFPKPPSPGTVPSCAEAGVMGVLPGIVGCLQANEAIKWAAGLDGLLDGKLLLFDALMPTMRVLQIPVREPRPEIDQLIDYEDFCGVHDEHAHIEEVEPGQLQQLVSDGAHLLDVREEFEFKIANLGGQLIPLPELESRASEVPLDRTIIVVCKTGNRSGKAIKLLAEKLHFSRLLNLKGGLAAYQREVDPGLTID